ncbi:MAG: DUF932 domain-containing protein [Candidatus Thorarchaeota archaeon]
MNRTIHDLRQEIHAHASQIKDVTATTTTMKLNDNWELSFGGEEKLPEMTLSLYEQLMNGEVRIAGDQMGAEMLEHAVIQLSQRLGIPSAWVRDPEKCPEPLRKVVFNWKFEHNEPAEYMMRLYNDDLRAVMSSQYVPFDHHELIEPVYDALDQEGLVDEVKVIKSHVGDTLSTYLVFDRIRLDSNPHNVRPMGDGGGSGGLYPAVYLSNSEIGTGSVRIHGGLFRSYCTNGLIIGWKADNAFRITHRYKNKQQLALLANEAIAIAMNMSEQAGQRFLQAQTIGLERSSLKRITGRWAAKYSIKVDNAERWLESLTAMHNCGGTTYADIINEATYLANRIDDLDESILIERMAGDMVMAEMPASEVLTHHLTA